MTAAHDPLRLADAADAEAPAFATSVEAARRLCRNERELQTSVARLLERFCERAGVALTSREEYTVATGRADAVYNRLIIEYEPPGSLRLDLGHRHTAHAVQQAQDYIVGVAARDHFPRERLLGLAFDGSVLVFVRFREGRWDIEPPLPWGGPAAARLLRAVASLASGRALTPENLVEDFGAGSPISQAATAALYGALAGHANDLPAALFDQWKRFFSEVSGYEAAGARLQQSGELRAFAIGMGLDPDRVETARLLFATHTYFSFLAKSIARLVLERYAGGGLGATPLTLVAALPPQALRAELVRLEEGGLFRTLGFVNLLEGDFFGWYTHSWTDQLAEALRPSLQRLSEYNPATVEEDPYAARDLLKKLYHRLMPRDIRHDLGEYYTPDWLAVRVLRQLGDPLYALPTDDRRPNVDFRKRLLDPACGSGTFPVLAIRAIKAHARRRGLSEADTLELILSNVVGIDLNPLAVLAARVGYLLAIADLVPFRRGPVSIPVFLADSVLPPTGGVTLFDHTPGIDTVVGRLPIPACVVSASQLSIMTDVLYEYVASDFEPDVFVQRMCEDLTIPIDGPDADVLRDLYGRTLALHRRGLDGVWARIVKNAFMPLFIGQFDYVVGNPPWVNWESLPESYRRQTEPLWEKYGLSEAAGGMRGAFTKDDISVLMTYAVADRFLRPHGKIALVITQTLFKTELGGRGFRRFQLPAGRGFRILHVDDMTELSPFEGASNRTAVFVAVTDTAHRYPVPYTYWRKVRRGQTINYDSTLEQVQDVCRRYQWQATHVDPADPQSPWITARPAALRALRRVLGASPYVAREGINTGGANGVYWLRVLAHRPDGLLVVSNVTEGARRVVENVTAELEPALVYPLLRG